MGRVHLSLEDLAATRVAEPCVTWSSWQTEMYGKAREWVQADIALGRVGVHATFLRECQFIWEFGWDLDDASRQALAALGMRGRDGRRRLGSGIFATVDAAVKGAIREFTERYRPVGIRIIGSDAKRNAHYASTYHDIAPEEYAIHVRRGDDERATPDGIGGILLRRLPGLEWGPIRPFALGSAPPDKVSESRAEEPPPEPQALGHTP